MNQQYLFLILLAVAFVALIVLPGRQRKKVQAQAQQLQNSLTPGTPVMMTSGMHGTVSGVGDTTVDVDIAPGVTVTFERRAIMQVNQPTPAAPLDSSGTGDGTGSTQAEFPAPGDDTPGDGSAGTTR
jgi:preprotein translocase subunit YajC